MTSDEMAKAMQDHANAALISAPVKHPRADSKTRLSYWFPLIEQAGLPVPLTRIIRGEDELEHELYDMMDGKPQGPSVGSLVGAINIAARELGGTPFFLRTDFTSAKHYWKDACFVGDLASVGWHVFEIAEFSAMCDVMGLPIDVWIVREMLKTSPAFHAFLGRMPITREFRFFVRDNAICHEQPYWPAGAIEEHGPDRDDWRSALAEISVLNDTDRRILEELTIRANHAVPGYWSVDWLMTTDRGWVLTDMAEGEISYQWRAVS